MRCDEWAGECVMRCSGVELQWCRASCEVVRFAVMKVERSGVEFRS